MNGFNLTASALVMAIAAGEPLAAQGIAPTDSLLARLTAEAVAANPGALSASASARAAALRVRPAGALPDPEVSAGVMDLILPQFAFRRSDFTEVDLGLEQALPWPGTLRARTGVARATGSAMAAAAATRRREVIVTTARLYYRLRYVVTARQTLSRQRVLLATSVEIATARYSTGSAPQSDPLQARLGRSRLDLEETALAEEEASLRAELGAIRNLSAPESLTVTLIQADSAALERLHQSLAEQDSTALIANPRLAARRAGLAAAQASVRVEVLGGRPDFTISSRYGARPIAADFFSALVGLRVPLWAGRKQHRLAEAARQDVTAAEAALAEEQRKLEAELRTVRAGIEAGRARIAMLGTQIVPTAREVADAALRGYRVGQVDFLSLLSAFDARFRAELELAGATADHLTHFVMLEELLRGEDQP